MPDGFVEFGRAAPFVGIAYAASLVVIIALVLLISARLNRALRADALRASQEKEK